MMRSDVRLVGLAVESFRGFRDRREFDLDASTVVITGPNGTGKTSFFDAMQWVLLGSIERLEGLRARKNVEHVVSRYRPGGRARVELTLVFEGREITVARTGDYRDSTLEVRGANTKPLFGDAARDWLGECLVPTEPYSLAMALTTCGLLQQDVMRSVLEAKPADRYAHITTVLGLLGLEDYEDAVRVTAKEANDQNGNAQHDVERARGAVETASAILETLEQRALQRISVTVARSEIDRQVAEMPDSVSVTLPSALDLEAVSELARRCHELVDRFTGFVLAGTEIESDRNNLQPAVGDDQIRELQSGVDAASAALETELAEQEKALSLLTAAEQSSEEILRLAAAALPQLTSHCPVCGQSIDPDSVAERLRSIAGDSSTLIELRASVESRSAQVDAMTVERDKRQSELDKAQEINRQWEMLRRRHVRLADELNESELVQGVPIAVSLLTLESVVLDGPAVTDSLARLGSALERYAEIAQESQSAGEIDRARAELASANQALDERTTHGARLATRAARLKQLADATAKARVDVTKARFEAIEPLVSDIYSRLDPHPAFKMIGFEHDTYYGKGTSSPVVRDLVAGVDADPLIVFSASQANIAALSYFLAMSLGAGERALPFVLLDDPLQSMDDVNVLGFADLCRFVRSERQLMISTHDRRFANLLRRKLTPRTSQDRTIVYEFGGWDRSGPSVTIESLEDELQDSPLRLLASSA
ncbi:MAG: AAA family ATPase [Acidimicrobiia bacterium]|nr:AAA family ATPase [Acidimicrobiia bacterium]